MHRVALQEGLVTRVGFVVVWGYLNCGRADLARKAAADILPSGMVLYKNMEARASGA